jgi:hypothetical protein
MNLIIGKNSLIVKKISKKLINFEFISHRDIKKYDLNKYNFIFLFSWPKNVDKGFRDLLELIPKKKLIFISSIAVFSCFLRPQPYKYPNQKLLIENYVLKNNGSVLRLGIFHKSWSSFNSNVMPYTSYDSLIKLLNSWSMSNSKVINLFDLNENDVTNSIFFNFLYKIHSQINIKFIRVFMDTILKFSGSKNYGYTKDCLFFFEKQIQIGYGVLGENLLRMNQDKVILTIVSGKKNLQLKSNGFRNTLIGYNFNGLKKFWHGVSIKLNKDGTFKKKSKIFISRKRFPKKFTIDHILKINDTHDKFEIIGEKAIFFSKKIYFAAGPVENVKLISSLLNFEGKVNFSDHDLILIGNCDTDELINKNYLLKKWFFIINNKIFTNKSSFMLDFRPFSKETLNKNNSEFYIDTTQNIIYKLIRGFSLSRINEAIFNKFGIAIYRKKTLCFAQILNSDCIELNLSNKKIIKKRVPNEFVKELINLISARLDSFNPLNSSISIDSQHIIGGNKLLYNNKLKNLIRSKRIYIAGSPTKRKLDFRHHSELLISDLRI